MWRAFTCWRRTYKHDFEGRSSALHDTIRSFSQCLGHKQYPYRGVIEDECYALGRVGRIKRHISATGCQDTEDSNKGFR